MLAREVPCPTCNRSVRWDAEHPFRPFCSKRCQLIDLGAWAAEDYRVPDSDEATTQAADETGVQGPS